MYAMKPIIFNTPMVKAIDQDIKTSTRRVIKPHVPPLSSIIQQDDHWCWSFWQDGDYHWMKQPYQVGDILYVRETWQQMYETECYDKVDCGYINIRDIIANFDDIPKVEAGISYECKTAQMEPRMKYYVFRATDIEYVDPENYIHWRPAIHMPKEAARTFLRVTSIIPQWLKDITAEEALREGITLSNGEDPRDAFAEIWNCTLKRNTFSELCWTANPVVWAIDFEKISKDEALAMEALCKIKSGGDGSKVKFP